MHYTPRYDTKKLLLKNRGAFLLIVWFVFVYGFKAQKPVSVLEACHYDEKSKQTVFSRTPYGSISLPGEWSKINYNEVSKQYFFQDKDSVLLGLAINPASNYPFYKKGMSPNSIVQEMFNWDNNYFEENIGIKGRIIEKNLEKHFILWQVEGKERDRDFDNHLLFGSEKDIVFSVFISTSKWSSEKKENFMRLVYESKTAGDSGQ